MNYGRSCISKIFLARGIDISHDRDLNMLVRNFAIERPVQHREAPRWDLMVVLRLLMKPPFEPMNMASLADMTRKLAFLLTLASAKRNSEVWAFSADVRFGQDYNAATLSFLPNFLAKTMDPSRPETDYAPVTIPALGPSMGEDLPDRLLCPVRALRYYLKLKHKGQDLNNRFCRLLCAFKLGHTGDISKQTVSGWIRQLIKQAYSAVQDEDIPHLTHTNFQARELRAFASSLAFHQNYETGHGSGLLEKQQHVCFILSERSLPNGGCDYGGPFRGWSASHILRTIDGNRATCALLAALPLLPLSRTGGHSEQWDPISHQDGTRQIWDGRLYSTFRVSSL